MDKKVKLGIALIAAAAVLGGFFLYQDYFAGQAGTVLQAEVEMTPEAVFSPAVTAEALENTGVPAGESGQEKEEMETQIKAEVSESILAFIQVSREDFTKETKIYANSCGYGNAGKVKDMGEMIVNYTEKTVTVPCYFTMKQAERKKFDVIYYYEKKKYRFVPW